MIKNFRLFIEASYWGMKPVFPGDTFTGWWANGAVTCGSFSVTVISGSAELENQQIEEWSAGSASGGDITVTVTNIENAIICCTQKGNGTVNRLFFIAGDGGKEWKEFLAFPEDYRANAERLVVNVVNITDETLIQLLKQPIKWHEVLNPAVAYTLEEITEII
jgi:hypothetical protein